MHGFAACRPRHERIREPRLRVRQVLHDESRSCGDWSNEISQRQVGRKSVAQPKRILTSRRPVYRLSLYRNAWDGRRFFPSFAQHFVNGYRPRRGSPLFHGRGTAGTGRSPLAVAGRETFLSWPADPSALHRSSMFLTLSLRKNDLIAVGISDDGHADLFAPPNGFRFYTGLL
jgi:hypothetical protein